MGFNRYGGTVGTRGTVGTFGRREPSSKTLRATQFRIPPYASANAARSSSKYRLHAPRGSSASSYSSTT